MSLSESERKAPHVDGPEMDATYPQDQTTPFPGDSTSSHPLTDSFGDTLISTDPEVIPENAIERDSVPQESASSNGVYYSHPTELVEIAALEEEMQWELEEKQIRKARKSKKAKNLKRGNGSEVSGSMMRGNEGELGPINLSSHAEKRIAQRNLTEEEINYVVMNGSEEYTGGGIIYYLGRRDIPEEDLSNDELRRLEGTVIVTVKEGTAVTVYRNRSNGRRDISKKPKRRFADNEVDQPIPQKRK